MSDDCLCKKCGSPYNLRTGSDPTDYCDLCAQIMVELLKDQNRKLRNKNRALKRHLEELK